MQKRIKRLFTFVITFILLYIFIIVISVIDIEEANNPKGAVRKGDLSNVQKITSAEKLRSRAFDEIVPFRKFIIKDDTSALL